MISIYLDYVKRYFNFFNVTTNFKLFYVLIVFRRFPLPNKHDPISHKTHNPLPHTKIV